MRAGLPLQQSSSICRADCKMAKEKISGVFEKILSDKPKEEKPKAEKPKPVKKVSDEGASSESKHQHRKFDKFK